MNRLLALGLLLGCSLLGGCISGQPASWRAGDRVMIGDPKMETLAGGGGNALYALVRDCQSSRPSFMIRTEAVPGGRLGSRLDPMDSYVLHYRVNDQDRTLVGCDDQRAMCFNYAVTWGSAIAMEKVDFPISRAQISEILNADKVDFFGYEKDRPHGNGPWHLNSIHKRRIRRFYDTYVDETSPKYLPPGAKPVKTEEPDEMAGTGF